MGLIEQDLRFLVTNTSGEVSAILVSPKNPQWLIALAHGASAGIHHEFMTAIAQILAKHRMASLRYNFPYMESGKRTPDSQRVLVETVRRAIKSARERCGDLPLIAGGKSLGGRMISTAASEEALPGVQGIVFFGFPLHAPGKPSTERGEHLVRVQIPMLFLQGTRDSFADPNMLLPLIDRLQEKGHAKIHTIDGGDHSFHILKKSGRTDLDVLEELGTIVRDWASTL